MELSKLKERNKIRKNTVHFASRFKHLSDHNGFRPGELHLLVGQKGGGKSTLFRDWILELILQGKKVYVRLSEDKKLDYLDELAKYFDDKDFHLMENLVIDSELNLTPDEFDNYFEELEMKLKNIGSDIMFLDNFTSSHLTRMGISSEASNAVKLRLLADKLGVPVVVAAHTEKAYRGDSAASGDNVRGNQTIANVAAYIYGITVFYKHPKKPTVIFTDKARHHSKSNKSYYDIIFNHNADCYMKDSNMTSLDMKELMKGLK